MRFLLDANLSPRIGSFLRETGHVVVHVRDVDLNTATDEQIMDFADREDYVVISQDSDFTALLFHREAGSPSLILLRDVQGVSAADIAKLLLGNLDQFHEALEHGAVVSVIRDRIRIRRLPIQ